MHPLHYSRALCLYITLRKLVLISMIILLLYFALFMIILLLYFALIYNFFSRRSDITMNNDVDM